jgi:hypothetical protein
MCPEVIEVVDLCAIGMFSREAFMKRPYLLLRIISAIEGSQDPCADDAD